MGGLITATRGHVPIRSSRPAWVSLAVGAPLIVLEGTQIIGNAPYVVLGLAALVAGPIALLRNQPRPQWAWWGLLVSVGLFAVGGAVRDAMDTMGDLTADRSLLPDLFTLPAYIVLIVSVVGIVRTRGRPLQTEGMSIDAAIIGLALLLVAWITLIEPALTDLDASARAQIAIALYPPLTVLLAAVGARLAFGAERRTPSTLLLLGGIATFVLGDILFTLTELHTLDVPNGVLQMIYGISWLLMGAALLHPTVRRVSAPSIDADEGFPASRLAVVLLALLTPAVVVILWTPPDTACRVVVGAITTLMAGLAVLRVAVALGQQRRTQQRLSRLAHNDSLTGLPNRTLVVDRTDSMLHACHEQGRPVALLFFDIDRFKLVNDTMGHAAGDALLVACAQRVVETVPPAALVGRISGDEFVIVLPDCELHDAHRHAEQLREAFLAPVPFGSDRFVTISIGVATSEPGDETDAATLLRDADTAMYLAKEQGRDAVATFDLSLRDRHARRVDVEARLRRAIDRDDLLIHYQPVVSLPTGRVVGMEALVRWPDARSASAESDIDTTEFVAVAEESGLIATIGRWVLHDATRQVALWTRRSGLEHLRLSVNVSPRELLHGSLVKVVRSALDSSGLAPGALWLELTERVLLDDNQTVLHRLAELRDLGVHVSVDDFGTGYSALAYLQRFPVEQVKIDRSFVIGLDDDTADRGGSDVHVVEAIIAMARALHLGVVAEGVETRAQAERLIELGCESAQGWWFAPPASPADLEPYLQSQLAVHRP